MSVTLRRIFDAQPATWQELELLVEKAFVEMGYETHRGHELKTVRGKVKVDVYAVKRSTPIPTVVLCECKYWAKPVEQNTVYGFRSICADVGAHFGLIISREGFQSGANETREATNVHLLDFNAFQETFFDEWRTGIFMKFAQMSDVLMPLIYNRYSIKDATLEAKLNDLNPFVKYEMFFGERSFSSYFVRNDDLPVELTDPRGHPKELRRMTIRSHREYFEVAAQGAEDANKHFEL